jgi:fused signal recognition particle receptor
MFGRLFGLKDDQASETPAETESPEEFAISALQAPTESPAAPAIEPPAEAPPPEPSPPEAAKKSWYQRLRDGLTKTSSQLTEGITGVFTKRKLDAATLEELEDLLIQADLGVDSASRITDKLSEGRYNKEISPAEVSAVLADEVEAVLKPVAKPLAIDDTHKPHVILVVGVNGSGKTTTIGKLASIFAKEGKRVMLAAGDTFRAAAIEQLKIWGERTGSQVVAKETGADAASLAFDALRQAREESHDIVIIDTAGRLQNKAHLMAELEKIIRVIRKFDATAPHTVLLTLDATTGQNALNQVEIFRKTAGVSGIIMTKLDGTARGGILVAIAAKHGLPIHAIGVGEGIDDLQPFKARDFANAIAGIREQN